MIEDYPTDLKKETEELPTPGVSNLSFNYYYAYINYIIMFKADPKV